MEIFSPTYLMTTNPKFLLLKESEPIYRHSFLGKFGVKDLKSGKVLSLNNGNFVQEPTFSPDGTKVAFIVDNNLYYQELSSAKNYPNYE
jgi:Dipeptidyl peptidase IV (DPP IV) N-terminal region.